MGSIGLAIKLLRKKKSWTLVDLSKKIRKSAGYISEVERGLKIPNLTLIKKVAKLLDSDVDFLRGLAITDKNKRKREKIRKEYGR